MASGITESTIEEIRSRIDIADLISSYGIQVRHSGASVKACCPFHQEKTPSFHIQPEKGFYHCFGCGKSGDAFKFVQEYEGLTFVEAVKKLAAQAGVAIEERNDPSAGMRKRLYALHAELAAFYHRCLLQMKEAEPARRYLSERKLSDEVAEDFQIGYAPASAKVMLTWAEKYGFSTEELSAASVLMPPRRSGGSWYNTFGGRLMFTIRDRMGRAVAFSGRILTNEKKVAKYVNSRESVIFKKSNVLFGLDKAASNIVKAKRREAIVCEGQIDVIRCHASGLPVAVASQGTAFTEEHVGILKKCADSVVLVFDADGAGRKASIRTAREFLAAEVPVRVATLPPGEDPDSLLRNSGLAAFQKCLDEAESIIAFQIRIMREAETNPSSIDAMARISKEVLATVAMCPSAVLRASMMNEAASILRLPVLALQSDFAKVKTAPAPVKPKESDGDMAAEAVPEERIPEEQSIAANMPPSRSELAFCEFLMENERDESLREFLPLMPEELFDHAFTRKFVSAWTKEFDGDDDFVGTLRGGLSKAETKWFDGIVCNDGKSQLSERSPADHIRMFLRRLWADAVRRLQGTLSAVTSEENDRVRLELSMLARSFERAPWAKASELMVVANIAEKEGAQE